MTASSDRATPRTTFFHQWGPDHLHEAVPRFELMPAVPILAHLSVIALIDLNPFLIFRRIISSPTGNYNEATADIQTDG